MTLPSDGWIDLTHPLHRDLPTWEDSEPVSIAPYCEIGPDSPVRVSELRMGSHNGTHLDAPSHFVAGGAMVEDLPLEVLMGEAWIADCGDEALLTDSVLESLAVPDGTLRLLLRTTSTRRRLMHTSRFERTYAGLDETGARWVVDRGIRLLGIDYLSVQAYQASDETHRTLLSAGVVLVEGLDLSRPAVGRHDLVCLPLLGRDLDGAPVRALARPA